MKSSTAGLIISRDSAIDLHLHTIYSDGRWRPEVLIDHLIGEGFALAAITDHDRADITTDLQGLAQSRSLPLLTAVEMSASWKGKMTDLLCYGFEPVSNALTDLARELLRRQQENTREAFDNLQRQGFVLSSGALEDLLAKPGSRQPPALVALLEDHGYGLGELSAGNLAQAAGCKFITNDPAAIVEAAHRSGAVCLVAHPGRENGFLTYDLPLLDQLRLEAPVDGLEAYYPLHSSAQTSMYQEYARRHHLLVSSGSDSHGPEKPPIKYRAELSLELLERLGIHLE
jgi:predicted metal-dependent phosphoesterase TrpH